MKRALITLLVVIGLFAAIVVGGAIWFQSQGSHRVLEKAQTVLSESGWELNYADNRLQWIPMRWVISGVTLQNKDKTAFAKISRTEIALGWNLSALTNSAEPLLDLRIDLESPDLLLRKSDSPTPEEQNKTATSREKSESGPPPIPPRDISLHFQVQNARARWREGKDGTFLQDGELQFTVPSFRKLIQNMHAVRPADAPPDFSGHARWTLNLTQLNLPFSAQWNGAMDQNKVQISKFQLFTLGVGLSAAGWLDHVTGHQSWAARAQVSDLSKLPSETMELPFQFTSGMFDLNLKAQKLNSWQAEGALKLKDLILNASYTNEAARAAGPIGIQGQVQFSYANETLTIPPFELAADLTQAELTYGDVFRKPKGLPSQVTIKGSSQPDRVDISQAIAKIGAFTVQTRAHIQNPTEKGPFQADVEIPLTSAESLRRFLPPMASAPLQGKLRTHIQISGSLDQFEKLQYQVKELHLSKVMGQFDWKSQDASTELKGDFALNAQVQASGNLEGLQQASGSVFADLSRMAIRHEDLFQKPVNRLMQVSSQFRLKGEEIWLQDTWARLENSRLDINGMIRGLSQTPVLKLTLGARPLKLTELAKSLPMINELGLNGEVQGSLQLLGQYQPETDFFKQSIAVVGDLSARLNKYVVSSSDKKSETTTSGSGSGASAEPVFPKGPLIEKSHIKYQVQIDELHYDELKIGGVSSRGELQLGTVRGAARIANLFGGIVQVKNYRWELVRPRSPITADIQATRLDLTRTMSWLAPQWKQAVGGALNGSMKIAMIYPLSHSPLNDLTVSGGAEIQNFKAHTKPITEMIQESLAQVPGIGGGSIVRDSTLNAQLETRFDLKNGAFQLRTFKILTSQNDELHLSGALNKDESIRLNGTAFLAKVPVKGSVRAANSDEKGRLILPLGLTGTLSSPKPQITEKTLQVLLNKTLQMEANKAKSQLQKQLSKEADKAKADLKEDLEKKAKNLLDQFLNKKKE